MQRAMALGSIAFQQEFPEAAATLRCLEIALEGGAVISRTVHEGAPHPKGDTPEAFTSPPSSHGPCRVSITARGFVIGHLKDISYPRCRRQWLQFAELHHDNSGNVRL